MVLTNDIIVDVFRCMDRRFMETRLRLTSRRAKAIVDRHFSHVKLRIDKMVFSIDWRDVVDFEIEIHHDKEVTLEQKNLPRPFETFDVKAIPRYIIAANLQLHLDNSEWQGKRVAKGPQLHCTYLRKNALPYAVNYIFQFPLPKRMTGCRCLQEFINRGWAPSVSVDFEDARLMVWKADAENVVISRLFTNCSQLRLSDLFEGRENIAACRLWLELPGPVKSRELLAPCSVKFDHVAFVNQLAEQFSHDNEPRSYTVQLYACYQKRRPGDRLVLKRVSHNMLTKEALISEVHSPPEGGNTAISTAALLEDISEDYDDDDDEDFDENNDVYAEESDDGWLLTVYRVSVYDEIARQAIFPGSFPESPKLVDLDTFDYGYE